MKNQITRSQTELVDHIVDNHLLENERFCDITLRYLAALRHALYHTPLEDKSRRERDLYEVLNEFQRAVGTERFNQAYANGQRKYQQRRAA